MSDFEDGLEVALNVARTGRGVSPNRQICSVCTVVQHVKPESREALEAAVAGTLSTRALRTALQSSGVSISREAIIKHRNEGHTP